MTVNGPELAYAADVMVRDYFCVKPGDNLLITADTATDRDVTDAVMNAAHTIGAKPAVMTSPQLPYQGALANAYISEPLAAAMRQCDAWIDLQFPYVAGSDAHDEAMKSNRMRYLLAGDLTAGGLIRMFGKVDLDQLYDVKDRLCGIIAEATGKEVRITNAMGADVTFNLAKPAFTKTRRAEQPGLYFVPGRCTMFPEPDSVRGNVAINAAFHEFYEPMSEPMMLTIDGKIQTVEGGGGSRTVMDRSLKRAGGGDYGYVIHFTYAIHPSARYTGKSFVEDSRVTGSNAVGLGIPFWEPGGGENHPDGVLTQQSIWIDGAKIVEDGIIVGPKDLAKSAEAVLPVHH